MNNYFFNEIDNIIENLEINLKVRQYQDNSEKLNAYWNIGKLIVEAQGGNKRAKYGNNLLKSWGEEFSRKYGKMYSSTSLRYMRLFYLKFPICHAVRDELTWTHYRTLLPIENKNERNYYMNLAIINHLSSRDWKIKNMNLLLKI